MQVSTALRILADSTNVPLPTINLSKKQWGAWLTHVEPFFRKIAED